MSCETEVIEALRGAGHKATPQRALILTALRHSDRHLTAANIFERVRADYPYVDISTVYRTLAVLKGMHLITETDIGTGDTVYEWAEVGHRHHHLICQACGAMTSIDDSYFEALGRTIREEYGFRPDMDHFAIFGTCADCSGGG